MAESPGFIILIVVLCLIILIALAAIYFLLREGTISDEELQKSYKRPRTATYVTPLEDDGQSQPNSWLRRTYQRLKFSRTASADRVPQIKVGQSQSQRGSFVSPRNDWHTESVDDFHLKAPLPKQPYRHSQIEKLDTANLNNPSPKRLSTTTSTGSVRFDLNSAREPLTFERDRFAPSPTATLPSIYTRMSSPPSSPGSPPSFLPKRSRSILHEGSLPSLASPPPARYEQDITQYSPVGSSPALTTFEGGTKFLETF